MSTDDTQKLPEGFDIIIARLDSFEQNVTTRLDSFEQRLTALEEKADRQAMETKPIWERALAEITETRAEMRERFDRIENEVQDTNHRMRALNNHLLDLAGRQERLEERFDKLDRQPS